MILNNVIIHSRYTFRSQFLHHLRVVVCWDLSCGSLQYCFSNCICNPQTQFLVALPSPVWCTVLLIVYLVALYLTWQYAIFSAFCFHCAGTFFQVHPRKVWLFFLLCGSSNLSKRGNVGLFEARDTLWMDSVFKDQSPEMESITGRIAIIVNAVCQSVKVDWKFIH